MGWSDIPNVRHAVDRRAENMPSAARIAEDRSTARSLWRTPGEGEAISRPALVFPIPCLERDLVGEYGRFAGRIGCGSQAIS